jgi:alpha-tubulin suppressor-like RCC1 family protein
MTGVAKVVSGWTFTIVQMEGEGGRMLGWGFNSSGQIGLGTQKGRMSPTPLAFPETIVPVAIGTGEYHGWAMEKDGTLWMWGQVGHEEVVDTDTPKVVPVGKLKIPVVTQLLWTKIYFWLFLGNKDSGSVFSVVPVEALYHVVTLHRVLF